MTRFYPMPFGAATAVYCSLIFYLSSISSLPGPMPFAYFDKVVHFCLFGGLGAIVVVGLGKADRKYAARARIAIAIAFSFVYGLSDEIHQIFVEYRTFDMSDLAADVAGAAFAAGLLAYLQRKNDSRG